MSNASRERAWSTWAIALLIVVLLPRDALAQRQDIDIRHDRPAVDGLGYFSTDSAEAYPLRWDMWGQLRLSYGNNLLSIIELRQNPNIGSPLDRVERDLVANSVDLRLSYAVSVHPGIQVGLMLPIIAYQGGTALALDGDLPVAGLGDLAITTKLAPLTQFFPRSRTGGVGVAVVNRFFLPTSTDHHFGGDRSLGDEVRIVLDWRHEWAHAAINFGYHFRFGGTPRVMLDTQPHFQVADELVYGIAVGVTPPMVPGLEIIADFFGRTRADDPFYFLFHNPAELNIGARYHLGPLTGLPIAMDGAARIGINGGYGAPLAGFLTSIAYAPLPGRDGPQEADLPQLDPERDDDGDGIPNLFDACTNDPEDYDGYMDDDGCPEPDNDFDGILDADDMCPNDPEDFDGFEDEDGCPELDRDGDGILDRDDKCPDEPEDYDGFEDENGCPEPDNDGDGIPDVADLCPNLPEDFDGGNDTDGCPDPDDDGDGIMDADDKCPTEPETWNGIDDGDGCPDAGESLVALDGDRIVLKKPIDFDWEKGRIPEIHFPILEQLASFLRHRQDLVKVVLRVREPLDPNPAKRKPAAQSMATLLQIFMVSRGVPFGRIQTATVPISAREVFEVAVLERGGNPIPDGPVELKPPPAPPGDGTPPRKFQLPPLRDGETPGGPTPAGGSLSAPLPPTGSSPTPPPQSPAPDGTPTPAPGATPIPPAGSSSGGGESFDPNAIPAP